MKFTDPDKALSEEDVAAAEDELGLAFPSQLRALFLENNGAAPEPYVFRSDTLETVVNDTLPLISERERGTAIGSYRHLVIGKAVTPRNFFPFAVDGGGDYFFVDCDDPQGAVYFFRSDSAFPEDGPLEKIAGSLEEFWSLLGPEEE